MPTTLRRALYTDHAATSLSVLLPTPTTPPVLFHEGRPWTLRMVTAVPESRPMSPVKQSDAELTATVRDILAQPEGSYDAYDVDCLAEAAMRFAIARPYFVEA